ncbi:DUF2846 domain-containing protein [Stenotrophomonas sp.]|uniref:DUF2846 domain-containing protein n=1 Tax=Stenotrophomonas sp. TaxID=69392 RepID=UPI0028B0964E|nr:DUF2846 domain-containing protein [Stenotrophomonas sp.]
MRLRSCAMALSASLLIPLGVFAQQVQAPTDAAIATQEVSASALEEAEAADTATAGDTAQTAPAAVADSPAAAESPARSGLIAAAPADKAQIVFFRPSKFTGGAIGFKVREGQQELGKLRSGNYFIHLAEPGTHEYTVHSEAKDVLTIEVEEGETYFVQGTITMGVFAGRPNLSPSDQSTFDGMADKLTLRE